MGSKEELINLIKSWIEKDNDIKKLQNLTKEKKNEKKQLTDELLNIMKEHEIECFDVKNGKLQYKTIKTKQTLNKKTLLDSLSKYFNDDPKLATEITEFVLDARGEKITETIKRKIIK